MPPKKPPADAAEPPAQSSGVVPAKEKSDAAPLRKLASHPSTSVMLREALKALDSRKGVSSQAIQNYIKQQYPSVDVLRLKHLVRRALKKGLESGTLVRPANSNITTGATGKFRLAPKAKEPKAKTENMDPNVQKEPKAKDGTKKPTKSGAKKKDAVSEDVLPQEDSKPPKKPKKDGKTVNPKDPPAKKPRGKKTAGDGDEPSTKAAKTTKEGKAGRATQSKTAKADSDGPATKTTGKRGKK